VSLHQEQLKEGELKFHRVASKRLLFLFKYLNASYLEGAAFNDIKANEAQAQEAEQRLLLETATLYYQWLNGYVGRLLSYESIQQGLGQLRINQDEFDTGESTSFDVLETEHQVLDRYRLYVAEEATTTLTLQSLLSGLNLPVAEADATANQHRYYPAGLTQLAMPALTHEGKVTQSLPKLVMLEPLQAIPATWTEKTVRALALDHRPSSQEARFRLASVQQLTKAASYDFDKRQGEFLASAVRQLQLKQHIVDQQLAQEARQAWQVYVSLVQQQEVVSQQLAVAQRFYQQRLASQRAGFANNNDVLQSQVLLTQAVLALTKAQAAINLQELKLRYVTGTLLDYVKTQQ
jgi:outer membrane protein TolC